MIGIAYNQTDSCAVETSSLLVQEYTPDIHIDDQHGRERFRVMTSFVVVERPPSKDDRSIAQLHVSRRI